MIQLYQVWVDQERCTTPFERVVNAYFNRTEISDALIDEVMTVRLHQEGETPWNHVEEWRQIAQLLLILREKKRLSTHYSIFLERFQKLSCVTLWSDFQLVIAYKILAEKLLEECSSDSNLRSSGAVPVSPDFFQFTSGAAPLEREGQWLWAEVPHPIYQAELGLVWCLIGDITGDTTYFEWAAKLAEWHQNTLDHHFIPFIGLYSQEGEASLERLLVHNYYFFDAVARVCNRSDMAFLAERQLEHLEKFLLNYEGKIPTSIIALGQWLVSLPLPTPEPHHPPKYFIDPDLALTIFRTVLTSGLASLYGGKSGMGCFHHADVQVVNFGPQYTPLGDCRGFGLEGAGRLLSNQVKSISASEEGFQLEGVARLPSNLDVTSQSGGWLEAKVEFNDEGLSITTLANDLFEQDRSFAFFIKAAECLIEGKEVIKPRSLQHYWGSAHRVHLKGLHGTVILESNQECEMHIIPLGGGENFWGADFLVAYVFSDGQTRGSWKLRIS